VEVGARNIESLLAPADIALDAADNFDVRFVLNDACVKHGKPWVYGGIIGAEGLMMPIRPGVGPCLRCALPEKPAPGSLPTGATGGILNAAPAVIAALQVVEALKILLGDAGVLAEMLHVDLWRSRFHTLAVRRHPNCPTCGQRRFEFLERAR
jgi:adenylyltransferase/sulfurtransferase